MATIRKKTKKRNKRINFLGLSVLVLAFVVVLSIFSTIFLGNINTQLTMQIQDINNEIASAEVNNEALNADIQGLTNKNRVMSVAADAGMTINQDNIIAVTIGD
jgi:cell division protein FtsL